MVKLRVAARVIPEGDYNAAQSTQSTERKFLVVVRNPEDWYIGTLAVEIQNTYKRIYKHDLGKIKYLKDADDFDLDTEQLVSDVFVNEGKADRDGLDQDAIIKVVQEQGQAVRQDSVVPDLTPVHYQKPPLPPVPRFSEVPQTLGKRNHDVLNVRNISEYRYGGKRFRQAEVDETQHEDELIPSVERSPELIADTQTSQHHLRRGSTKLESPDLSRSFRDIAPANEDELELLPRAPPNFPSNRRNYVLGGEHLTPRANGLLLNPATRSSAANPQSQLPITPPTDPAVADPTSLRPTTNGLIHGSRSPALGGPSTSTKFKPARQNLYEMVESDIEDSQMSPGRATLPIPRLVKKMSSIENMPNQEQSSIETFNAQAALDPMDLDEDEDTNEAFIAEKKHSVSMHNDFGDRARKAAAARRDASLEEIEIPATASDPKQSKSSQTTVKPGEDTAAAVGQVAPSETQESEKASSKVGESDSRPASAGTGDGKSRASVEEQLTKAEKKKRKSQKKRASKQSRQLEQQEQQSTKSSTSESTKAQSDDTRRDSSGGSSTNKASTPSSGKRSVFDAGKKPRRSSQLDSPGEQLSQALQESARKPSLSAVRSKPSDAEGKGESRPSTSGSGSTNANTSTPTSRRSSSGTTGSSPGRLGLGITNSPRKKKMEALVKKDQKAGDSTLTDRLKKAKEDAEPVKKKHTEPAKTSKDMAAPLSETAMPSVEHINMSATITGMSDLDTHCSVMRENGQRCKRALDCRAHNLPAKRAVPGRSQPFDNLLRAFKTRKEKGRASLAKSPLPYWGSGESAVVADKMSVPAQETSSTTAKASSAKVIPPWMSQEEYERMTKGDESKGVEKKEEKEEKAKHTKETTKPAPQPPEIKVSEDSGSESSSSSESETESESGSEDSESEDEEEKQLPSEKKSTKQAPASKKATKDDTKLKTPKPANLQRESTTPGSDFESITSKLKSIKHTPGGSNTTKLQPPTQKSTLKKHNSVDTRSSAAGSETPQPSIKKPTPSVASSSASKPAKPAAVKSDKNAMKATPQVATPAPAHETLAGMKIRLRQESREASKRSTPAAATAKGFSLGGQGEKKVFDESDESSSSDSSSSSSKSEDSDDGKRAKSKRKRVAEGKGKGGPSAVPDRSIRDPTPDVDSSDED